jgi:hypothetical protein
MTLAHREFAKYLPKYKQAKLTPVAQSPNNVAVVLWVQVAGTRILLGSDLGESENPSLGWQAIVGSKVRAPVRAHLFKVPHHGSDTAHSDDVWNQMLVPSPVALLTPFIRGHKPLPSNTDIERIKTKTSQVYTTARSGGWKPPRRDRAVERLIEGRNLRAMSGVVGHVRIRWSVGATHATDIGLFSGASAL